MPLDAAAMPIDLSEFEPIPEARRLACPAINVSLSGYVSLNKPLLDEIQRRAHTLKLGFAWHKHDKRILVLYPTETPNYTFPGGGSRKDTYLTQTLVEEGIVLPARYFVKWNDKASAWVGILSGDRVPDALTSSLNPGQRTRRKRV